MNTSNYPNPFERVTDYSKESLEKITDRLSKDYQRKIYGYQRYGENVRYKIEESGAITESFVGIEQAVGAKKLTVYVEHNGKEINFSVPVYLPEVSKHNRIMKANPPEIKIRPWAQTGFLLFLHRSIADARR